MDQEGQTFYFKETMVLDFGFSVIQTSKKGFRRFYKVQTSAMNIRKY